MAAINCLQRKFLSPENSILLFCDEDKFVEEHQSKINYVAIFLTSNSKFTGYIRDKLDNLNFPSLPDHTSESFEGKFI